MLCVTGVLPGKQTKSLAEGGASEDQLPASAQFAVPAPPVQTIVAPATGHEATGLTLFEAVEAGPVPAALVAVTANVYAVPLARPVTTIVVAPVVLAMMLPGEEVTVYAVIAEPPFDDGAVQLTVACPLPAVAVTPVGAPGMVAGLTAFEAADAGPMPAAFVAVTVNV
jgi:hypothetical protein